MSIVQRARSIASTSPNALPSPSCSLSPSRISLPAAGTGSDRRRSSPASRRAPRTRGPRAPPSRRAAPRRTGRAGGSTPTTRLLLAAVPVEHVGEQPARLLLRVRSLGLGQDVAGEPASSSCDALLLLVDGSRSDRRLCGPAAGSHARRRRARRAAPRASRAAAGSRGSRRGCRPRPRARVSSGSASSSPSSSARSSTRRCKRGLAQRHRALEAVEGSSSLIE